MLLMIFASRHLSAGHALSLRLSLGSELIDLAFQFPSPLPPLSCSPGPGEAEISATTGDSQKALRVPVTTIWLYRQDPVGTVARW